MESPSEAFVSDKHLELNCLSWNIEGLKRNHLSLKIFCDKYKPDLLFLSEPQFFQCDISLPTRPFLGDFCVLLNSEETNNPELALDCSRAHGGTMVMWKTELDPHVHPLPTPSPAFLPILLTVPGYLPSIHIALYLPTSGKDPEFVSTLSLLDAFIEDITAEHACPIYIRGDANCNPNNHARSGVFQHFCSKHKFTSIDFGHPSHHHFTGDGLYDAQLDVLLHQTVTVPEVLSDLLCKLDNPLIESAHDIIVSTCFIPSQSTISQDTSENITAPKVENTRIKII